MLLDSSQILTFVTLCGISALKQNAVRSYCIMIATPVTVVYYYIKSEMAFYGSRFLAKISNRSF